MILLNKTFYKTIDETLYHEKLHNGLNIYLLPKPGFHKTYATIYASLAILLFSFFWIYVSWIIYLYGIKMCHRINIQEELKIKNS